MHQSVIPICITNCSKRDITIIVVKIKNYFQRTKTSKELGRVHLLVNDFGSAFKNKINVKLLMRKAQKTSLYY